MEKKNFCYTFFAENLIRGNNVPHKTKV